MYELGQLISQFIEAFKRSLPFVGVVFCVLVAFLLVFAGLGAFNGDEEIKK